ncbi:MAG: hypothetical protein LJE95_08535 [Acidobacteria bacterium]|nr:hypothetical protein [Acidobacteriota bacterium]
MTTVSIESVGLCAHFSTQGDWAFDFAFALARHRQVPLNVFHFLADPFDPTDQTGRDLPPAERARLAIERERVLRFRYEDKLGDFLIAGFRLCEESEWSELHRCLRKREFQVLVLPWPRRGCSFGRRPLERFVAAFVCPIIVIGPESPYVITVNPPAVPIAEQVGLAADGGWSVVGEGAARIGAGCELAVTRPAP